MIQNALVVKVDVVEVGCGEGGRHLRFSPRAGTRRGFL